MCRLVSPSIFVTLLVITLCATANADPDYSIINVAFAEDATAEISASGNTQVDIVIAVIKAMEENEIRGEQVKVGPYLALPEEAMGTKKVPQMIVYVGDRNAAGKRTGFVAVSPAVPFRVVASVSEALKKSGCDDVRLLSEENFRKDLLDAQAQRAAPSQSTFVSPAEVTK